MEDSAIPHLDELYDEFGFARDEETNPGQEQHDLVEQEDAWQRQQWSAYLEYTQRQQTVTACTCGNMCWQCSRAFKQVNKSNQQGVHPSATTPRWDMVERMARRGVPHSLRPQVWMTLTGACQKKEMEQESYHHQVTVSVASSSRHGKVFSQIEEDLLRTMSRNACFSQLTSPGLPRLRRVLRALACRYPHTGYCQGTGPVVASLLLFLEEEDAFWMMCALIDDLLPESYYSPTLTGIQVDQRVLRQLLVTRLPATHRLLQTHDVELSLVTMPWFLTLFAGVLPMKVLLRLWDVLFCSGSQALFLLALALLELKEDEVKTLDSSAQILSVLSALPANVTNAEQLIELAVRVSSTVTSAVVSHERRKHLTYLLAFQSAAWDSEDHDSPPKQPSAFPTRWAVRWLWPWWRWVTGQPEEENEEEEEGRRGRGRNPRHTELMLEAREAILLLAGVCQSADAEAFERPAQENYSVESHAHDLENYAKQYCQRHHLRHRHHCRHVRSATCRLDQDAHRHFGKNDTGIPIPTPAEHWCQGDQKGPSSRLHSHSNLAELRTEAISELVGSRLQQALTAVMMHGLRKSKVIGGDRHPWLVLQEVAEGEVEKASQNECCRQMLCRSYRLDEDDCNVPTPEDLLHLAVQTINTSRGLGHESMDLKFHSLLCYGLNEQVLHLWLECLCCCSRVVAKWYQPWALLCTPAWVHLKCQLRLLSSTAFQLTGDGEVFPRCSEAAHPLPQVLKDMRPAQQLFSWDL